jgi:hypothetical protein
MVMRLHYFVNAVALPSEHPARMGVNGRAFGRATDASSIPKLGVELAA